MNDGTEEAQAYFDEAEKQLAALDAEMDLLNKVGEKLSDIRPGDVLATATLSPEARGVYHYLLSGMGKGNKEKSARVSALLAARMTDRLVAFHREAGDNDYTAMDALPELLANAEQESQGKEAAQLRQEEVQSQKDAVRKQYEGTAMWMKAPNGKPTNLTEEQWLLVRTPAFKAWFGDWEAEYRKQENIERGTRAVDEVLHTRQDVPKAMFRSETGGIDFVYGKEGDPSKKYAGGYGIAHILAKHGQAAVDMIPTVIAKGKAAQKHNDRIRFNYAGYTAVVRLDFDGNQKTWLVTNFEKYANKKDSLTAEVFARSADDPDGAHSTVGGNLSLSFTIPQEEANSQAVSKVVDENGEPKVVYHGTKRKDRVGSEFRKDRATSGPMAYFTDAFEIAEGYSRDKEDTSQESLPYEDQFRIKTAEGADIPLYKHWPRLPLSKRQEIAEKAKHITQDDDGNIIYDETEGNGLGNFAYQMKEAHGNAIRALEEGWLNDGTLYEEEDRFLEVLKFAGVEEEGLFYADPNFTAAGVFSVFMAMKNPFNTMEQVTKGFLRSLRAAAKKAPKAENPQSFDLWDKKAIEPMDFVARVERDIEKGTTHAWTAIPDWVTAFLVSKGYDGIQDEGGKHYEAKHTVYIPFEPTQIKSVDNNGNFDPADANIYHQEAGRETAEERANRISQEVFQTYLNDGIMKSVEETVAAEIGEYVNLDAMADPAEKDKARDHLPYIKALLVQFNSRTVQKNVDYKDRYAAKIEYARRCFDNDERIKAGVTRQMVGNEGQGDLHQNRNGAGPTEHKRGNGAAVQRLHGRISAGISNQVSGEKRGAREHFEKLYNEIAKKHSENQGAFSNALLEQAIRQEVKGNYDQAQAIIRLFEGADPSTFMHEMSHHYLSELAKLAQMFPESEAAKDYETIMQWASWQEGQVNAYAGTASAKEFQARDEAIRKAEKAGDTLEVKRLKDVWAQERFARAFEEYLHSGDAPIFLSRLCGGELCGIRKRCRAGFLSRLYGGERVASAISTSPRFSKPPIRRRTILLSWGALSKFSKPPIRRRTDFQPYRHYSKISKPPIRRRTPA